MVVLGGVSMMSACVPTGDELYAQAREVNLTAKKEVAALQLYLLDDEWEVFTYGDIADPCGSDGYEFSFERSTPSGSGWRLPHGTVEAQIEDIAGWLHANGWVKIVSRSYTQDVASATIEASKPDSYVKSLVVMITPGEATDGVQIWVETTCEPGNVEEVYRLVFPDGLPQHTYPGPDEHPSADPAFGNPVPSATSSPSSTTEP
jgi:hypothetical protein